MWSTRVVLACVYKKSTFMWACYGLIVYCLLMDVVLYRKVQDMVAGTPEHAGPQTFLTAPFQGLSVKLMMLDHINHYVHFPAAVVFNQVTNFSDNAPWITPNMISGVGFAMAVVSARLVISDSLSVRQLGVLTYQIRNFLDAMDGMVHRARTHQTQNISLFGSLGYLVDATADTVGMAILLIGCFIHLYRQKCKVPLARSRDQEYADATVLLMPKLSKVDTVGATPNNGVTSTRRVLFVVLCFGAQVGISALAWDRYISGYYAMLQTHPKKPSHVILQKEVLGSSLMWIIMWLWRVCNAHALTEMLLLAILLDKIWEFLTWVQYVGFGVISVLMLVTEIHYCGVQRYLGYTGELRVTQA